MTNRFGPLLTFLGGVSLLASVASAAANSEQIKTVLEKQPYCQNFVKTDHTNLYFGFGPYRLGLEEPRMPIPSRIRVAPIDGSLPFELMTNDSTIDVSTDGKTAYVLTHSSIEEWDLTSRERKAEYPTFNAQGPLDFKQHAEGMARYKDELVIAHGRLGISVFDVKLKMIINQIRLLPNQRDVESMATGVTIQGDTAYIAMDNFTLPPPGEPNKAFRGVVVMNMKTQKVVATLPGNDAGADSILSDSKNLFVSYMGTPIWKYSIDSLASDKLPQPKERVWKFPLQGHPTGAADLDDKYYYTCFSRLPYPNEPQGLMMRVPMALERALYKLD